MLVSTIPDNVLLILVIIVVIVLLLVMLLLSKDYTNKNVYVRTRNRFTILLL